MAAALVLLALAGCGSDREPAAPKPRQPEVRLGTDPVPKPAEHERATTRREAPLARPTAQKPPIRRALIPFDAKRRRETEAYTQRHYGRASARLEPRAIVEHFTVTPTAAAARALFSRDVPDVELKELPGLCSHFLIDRDGTIEQLVPVDTVCRHTVGLNDSAIGIEHVGSSDSEVMGNRAQLRASLRLSAWLRCTYGIAVSDVIGHAESLSSRFHHENVAALKSQSHDDFAPAAMNRYRRLLRRRACA
jgi:N-acetylmuramoyl-L-alanine amidase